MKVEMSKIRIDCGTQNRAELSQPVIEEYAEAMKDGDVFPAITLFDDGGSLYLADGFHRYFANQRLGNTEVEAIVMDGTLREALLHSFSANAIHGARRSNMDKRKIVMAMLDDFEWGEWSDRAISKHCGVSHTMVAKFREEGSAKKTEPRKFERGGAVHEMAVKAKPVVVEEVHPEHDSEREMQDALIKQNEELTQRLAIAHLEGTDSDKKAAGDLLDELREENKQLRIELNSIKTSRDAFQEENAQLKKQVAIQQKKLKKLGIQ
jgi:transposase